MIEVPQQTIYFDKDEDDIIEAYQKVHNNCSKVDAIKQIVKSYKPNKGEK